MGSIPTPGTEAKRDDGENRAHARFVWESNSAALSGQQAEPRAGAQTNFCDDKSLVAGETTPPGTK